MLKPIAYIRSTPVLSKGGIHAGVSAPQGAKLNLHAQVNMLSLYRTLYMHIEEYRMALLRNSRSYSYTAPPAVRPQTCKCREHHEVLQTAAGSMLVATLTLPARRGPILEATSAELLKGMLTQTWAEPPQSPIGVSLA